MSIGQNISKLRRARGMTQEQLADQSGLTTNYLSKIERDLAKNFSAKNLVRIANTLGVPINELTDNMTKEVKSKEFKPNQKELIHLLDEMDEQKSEKVSRLITHLIKLLK